MTKRAPLGHSGNMRADVDKLLSRSREQSKKIKELEETVSHFPPIALLESMISDARVKLDANIADTITNKQLVDDVIINSYENRHQLENTVYELDLLENTVKINSDKNSQDLEIKKHELEELKKDLHAAKIVIWRLQVIVTKQRNQADAMILSDFFWDNKFRTKPYNDREDKYGFATKGVKGVKVTSWGTLAE